MLAGHWHRVPVSHVSTHAKNIMLLLPYESISVAIQQHPPVFQKLFPATLPCIDLPPHATQFPRPRLAAPLLLLVVII